jgi:hypothetical protein
MQLFKRRNGGIDPPGRKADYSSLAKYVYSEAMLTADFMGKVQRAILQEKFFLGRTEYLKNHLLHSLSGHYFTGRVFKLPKAAQLWRLSDLHMQVACLVFYGRPEVLV